MIVFLTSGQLRTSPGKADLKSKSSESHSHARTVHAGGTSESVPNAAAGADEASARFAWSTDLQRRVLGRFAEHRKDMSLSDEEIAGISEMVITSFAEKVELEKKLVQVEEISAERMRLWVPSYPEQGAAIKAELEKSIVGYVGPKKFSEVDQYLGNYLYDRFAAFGLTEQQYEITQATSSSEVKFSVNWMAKLPSELIPTHGGKFVYVQRTATGTVKAIASDPEIVLAADAITLLLN